jgi:hypothetical protein
MPSQQSSKCLGPSSYYSTPEWLGEFGQSEPHNKIRSYPPSIGNRAAIIGHQPLATGPTRQGQGAPKKKNESDMCLANSH